MLKFVVKPKPSIFIVRVRDFGLKKHFRYLSGDTYPHRDIIKQNGATWDNRQKAWMLPEEWTEEKCQLFVSFLLNNGKQAIPVISTEEYTPSHTVKKAKPFKTDHTKFQWPNYFSD